MTYVDLFLLLALCASVATGETGTRLLRASESDWRDEMLTALNDLRAQYNKAPMGMNGKLEKAAQKHAAYMAQTKVLSHVGAGGSAFTKRITDEAYQFRSSAENVAQGQETVEKVMEDWKNSLGHFENMLGDYACAGFGLEYASNGIPFWCQDFGSSDVESCEAPNGAGSEPPSPPSMGPPPSTPSLPPQPPSLSPKSSPLPPKTPVPPTLSPLPPKTPSPPIVSPTFPKTPFPPTASPTVPSAPSPPKTSPSAAPVSNGPPSGPASNTNQFGWNSNRFSNRFSRLIPSGNSPISLFGSRISKQFGSSESTPGISPQSVNKEEEVPPAMVQPADYEEDNISLQPPSDVVEPENYLDDFDFRHIR
uniref:RXLR1 n=1 Tax=Albugo laibachii Nc14 TaxID=890382 RepID=F0WUS2_9STRA|nr:RXLR1 [Albugo laibachii Nc14]|eukprot:CCA25158.1 RXLR1 [Albugo laibachii Nc14]